MRVLLVEDDRSIMMVTTSYIKSFGHEVIQAVDGETAIELFDPDTIDLVLMDYLLPGIDGFETTRKLREIHSHNWFPIIFITSATDDEHLSKGLESGGDDYLYKPVTPIVLESKIKAMARIVKMQSDLLNANKMMEKLSYLDGLTKIYNRRGFDRAAEKEWRSMQREGKCLSFLMIDVDHFKKYNDYYGHQKGDECLQHIASVIEEQLYRPADIVARYGGEEFVVLMPNATRDGAMVVAERLVQSIALIEIPHEDSITSQYVTISVGAATIDKGTDGSIDNLLKAADEALYDAKNSGRNQSKLSASF